MRRKSYNCFNIINVLCTSRHWHLFNSLAISWTHIGIVFVYWRNLSVINITAFNYLARVSFFLCLFTSVSETLQWIVSVFSQCLLLKMASVKIFLVRKVLDHYKLEIVAWPWYNAYCSLFEFDLCLTFKYINHVLAMKDFDRWLIVRV